jgi:hypothetical protein
MKKKLQTVLRCRLMFASLCTVALAATIFSSCTKKSDTNYASPFIGTWNVSSNTCGSGNSSFVISAGSGSNSLSTSGSVGNTGCVSSITENGTASSNACAFSPQTFTDGCGLSYTISATGTLSGGTLTFTESVSGGVNATCTVTATK